MEKLAGDTLHNQIIGHIEVVGSRGTHMGRVDHLESVRIKLNHGDGPDGGACCSA